MNQRRVGVLKVEDRSHPATRMFTSSWPIAEEFYTSLGHLQETWTNDSAFRAHLTDGIRWALGLEH